MWRSDARYRATVADPTSGAALGALLDDELRYDATTTRGLSNHLPMALLALHRLGATDERLESFASAYRRRLRIVGDTEPIGSFDAWLASRGRTGSYAAARAYFGARIDADGADATLRAHLPQLVDGLGGAAFHGVIRLAYGIESGCDARIAAGLAYLGEVHMPLGPRGLGPTVTDDPIEALAVVASRSELVGGEPMGRIADEMNAVARHGAFDGVIDLLSITSETPAKLTAAATALYAATDDFTALHAVTASHAIHVVGAYVEDTEAMCAFWFQAMAAAYATIGAPRLTNATDAVANRLDAPATWAAIAAAAVGSDDEHVIKLAYSAAALDQVASDPLLPAVAARTVGLVA